MAKKRTSAGHNQSHALSSDRGHAPAGCGLGNAQLQDMLNERVDATGFHGDPDAFRARMEAAFDCSFARVRMVGGEEGAAHVSGGVAATAKGDTIWMGALFAELAEEEQEEVLAHELAHVHQAMSGAAPRSGEDPEADANHAAGLALAGQAAHTTVSTSAGSAHNFSLGESLDRVGETAVALAIEQVHDLPGLLALIAEFGETAALQAIEVLAEHRVELIVGLLLTNPGAVVVGHAFRTLSPEQLTDLLQSHEAHIAAAIVMVGLAAGCVVVIAPALIALGAGAYPILHHLGGPAITLIWACAPDEMKDLARHGLVSGWPVGLGMELDASIGATFGYPVHVGGEAFFTVSHMREGVFQLRRGGIATEALDTGAGVGGYVGLGKNGHNEGGLGIGAELGSEVQAGVRQVVLQEFEFPILEDDAFAAFLVGVLQADLGPLMGLFSLFSSTVRSCNPVSYNTLTKLELESFAEGNLAAQGGLRVAGKETTRGGDAWLTGDGARDNGSTKWWWASWTQASAFANAGLNLVRGVETRTTEFTTNAQGDRVPATMEVDLHAEGSGAIAMVHAIPLLSRELPDPAVFDEGVGIKVMFTLRGGPTDTEPVVSPPTWQLLRKSGDFDRYDGDASETTLAVGNLTPAAFESLDAFLSNIQGGSYLARRIGLGHQFGQKCFQQAERQGAFSVMLPAEYRSAGLRVEGYLDIESQLTADMMRGIFSEVAGAASGLAEGGAPLQQLYHDVEGFLATGEAPAELAAHAEHIANTVLSGLTRLHLHGLVGLSVAGGGKVAAGGKARLQGSAGLQLTMDVDILSALSGGGTITVDDIRSLLEGGLDAGARLLEVEPSHG